MSSEFSVKPEKMKSSDCATAGECRVVGEIRHLQPFLPDQKDGYLSWLRAEFVAANAIIDNLCHHMRCVGEPGEYEFAIECVQRRRVSWNPELHLQQFFPCPELVHALQQVELRRQQHRVVNVGREEIGRSVVLDLESRQVHQVGVNGRSHGVDAQNLNLNDPVVENRLVKEREEGQLGHDARKGNDQGLLVVSTATVDASLETPRNPVEVNNPCRESRLKDVKIEEPSNYEVIDSTDDVPYGGGDYEANSAELFPTIASESRSKWSHDEDLYLIKAWLITDKFVSANHKPKPYWERISEYYCNMKLDTWVLRGANLCKQRWARITWPVHKFVSCYEEASKQKTRNQLEDDIIRTAHQHYHNDIGKDFTLEHAWRALRSESKWRDKYLKVSATDTDEDGESSVKRRKNNETEDSDCSEASLQFETRRKK
ncbi:hypothetical protein V2J09_003642 [Rumex salicifolius]